jgi:hypothetical protein
MGWASLSAAANRVAFDRLGSVSVTAGAASGRGFLKQNSEMLLGGEVISIDYALTCETSIFGSLAYGDLVTVDGTKYEVRYEPMRQDDGTFCVVPLALPQLASNNITTLSGLRLVTQDGQYMITIAA